MIFAVLNEAAERGELLLTQDGLCRWRRRRDGTVVIREILVLPFRRRTGVGRRLVGQVQALNPGAVLVARCPVGYEANTFWGALGFRIARNSDTSKVYQWERHPPSSTAPAAIQPSDASPGTPAG
jgi:GNAT superfamily N-acetyltransferase